LAVVIEKDLIERVVYWERILKANKRIVIVFFLINN
jgi:hypothetical protein